MKTYQNDVLPCIENPGIVQTRTAEICLGEHGIIIIKIKPGAELELADAIENAQETTRLAAGKPALIITDARLVKSASREVRRYGARPESKLERKANAILAVSQLSRLIGNFYLRLSPPPYPSRMFDSMENAVAWLLEEAEHE